MLRLPRRQAPNAATRQQSNRPTVPCSLAIGQAQLILARNAKITWVQFEALRIKLARTLTFKRRLSRKAMFKQQAHRKKEENKKKQWENKPTLVTRRKCIKLWYTGFPHRPYRVKGRGSRMGKGKGNISSWYFKGNAGAPLLYMHFINKRLLIRALHKVTKLLPVCAQLHSNAQVRWVHDEILDKTSLWLSNNST